MAFTIQKGWPSISGRRIRVLVFGSVRQASLGYRLSRELNGRFPHLFEVQLSSAHSAHGIKEVAEANSPDIIVSNSREIIDSKLYGELVDRGIVLFMDFEDLGELIKSLEYFRNPAGL